MDERCLVYPNQISLRDEYRMLQTLCATMNVPFVFEILFAEDLANLSDPGPDWYLSIKQRYKDMCSDLIARLGLKNKAELLKEARRVCLENNVRRAKQIGMDWSVPGEKAFDNEDYEAYDA